jgi:hypothetical protein
MLDNLKKMFSLKLVSQEQAKKEIKNKDKMPIEETARGNLISTGLFFLIVTIIFYILVTAIISIVYLADKESMSLIINKAIEKIVSLDLASIIKDPSFFIPALFIAIFNLTAAYSFLKIAIKPTLRSGYCLLFSIITLIILENLATYNLTGSFEYLKTIVAIILILRTLDFIKVEKTK